MELQKKKDFLIRLLYAAVILAIAIYICRRAVIVLLPFVIGILTGFCASFLMKHLRSARLRFVLLLAFLCASTVCGLLIDRYVFHAFSLNYLLIGMAFSATGTA